MCHDDAFEISLDMHIYDQLRYQSLSIQSSGIIGLACCRPNSFFLFRPILLRIIPEIFITVAPMMRHVTEL